MLTTVNIYKQNTCFNTKDSKSANLQKFRRLFMVVDVTEI